MSKYDGFTNEEIYMLKRQAIESLFNIIMTNKYNEYQRRLHSKLLNELTQEDSKREYNS